MPDISVARAKAENRIYSIMNDLDSSGYNAGIYKSFFKTMTDKDFIEFMKKLSIDPDFNLFFEIDSLDKKATPNIELVRKVADKWGIKLVEYVVFPYKNRENPESPSVSRTPIPVVVIQVRRLQQLLDKKNAASANTDKINSLTGQVTGDSKAASLSDMQTMALATSGQFDTIKEFLGPRSDDQVAKMKMLESIEKYGTFDLNDLNINTENKRSVKTMKVFLEGAGFDCSFGNTEKKKEREKAKLEKEKK
jgi:hypothetical protein